ncbi:uncharacterized protein LOC134195601 [Corticium candelabrum]|uniref:uncharacterized protein LOC134195601 n=1 Tax=Corticium candelabrum TaxID=121492 RepID=UPI002E26E1B0|nr:uncharacterized protein LOC134195601 [Corticium candelabrum]XP_062520635.1 uncharacterized protein LOC134195601 [Corticium candelabrum]
MYFGHSVVFHISCWRADLVVISLLLIFRSTVMFIVAIAGILQLSLVLMRRSAAASSGGGSYVQCYRVEKKVDWAPFGAFGNVSLKKGKPLANMRRALSNEYQVLNSTDLFGSSGYHTNTVCEYHFKIETRVKVKFYSIDFDERSGDPSNGLSSFKDCERAPQSHDRDYLELNVIDQKGKSRVFCGRGRRATRRILPKDLRAGESELVITFWSDSVDVGKGFSGILRRL